VNEVLHLVVQTVEAILTNVMVWFHGYAKFIIHDKEISLAD